MRRQFFHVKILRRALFALPCVGILVTAYLAGNPVPAHYMLRYWEVHRQEIEQYDDRQAIIGLSSVAAMIIWCIVFGKDEPLLKRIGWGLVVLGFYFAIDIRLID